MNNAPHNIEGYQAEKYDLLTSSPINQEKANTKLAPAFAAIPDTWLLQEIRRRRLLEASSLQTIKDALKPIQ